MAMGLDPETSCRLANRCVNVSSCAGRPQAPVCSTTFVTIRSRCVADLLGATVLHEGACLFDEGRPCERYPAGTQANCEVGQVCIVVEGRNRCAKP